MRFSFSTIQIVSLFGDKHLIETIFFRKMDTTDDEDSAEYKSNFELCIICQKKSTKKCIDPSLNSDQKVLGQGYSSFATQLKEFNCIGTLKCPRLKRMVTDHEEN